MYKEEDINNNLREYYDMTWAPKVPTPIANIIDAIGLVQCGGDIEYHPVVAAPVYYENGKLMPRSENVLLSTLRQTVEALADRATPPRDRTRFKDTCPIPGAVWNDDDTLSNPDDIIPQHYYTNKELQNEDLTKLHSCTWLYCRNTYLSGKYLEKSKNGRKSWLVSCKLIDIKMNPRNREEITCCYKDSRGFDISSPVQLSYRDQLEGLQNLLGEVPESDQHVIYYPRCEIKHSYVGYVNSSMKFLDDLLNCKNLEEKPLLLRSIPLTITSRGIGFTIAQLVRELCIYIQRGRNTRDVPDNLIYKLYRVSLGVFEYRLRAIWPKALRTTDIEDYSERKEEYKIPFYSRDENPNGFLPKSIMNIIKAIGLVECEERAYHPVVAAPVYYENGKLMSRSENVLLSTLRQTVEALADPATPPLDRTRFKDTCPIPGAVWNDDDTLSNPDDIIPQGYTHRDDYPSNLQRDMADVERLSHLGFRNCDPLNIHVNKDINTGDKSMLSTNVLLEMRVSPRHRDEALDEYSNRCRVEGDMSEYFTSPVRLNMTQQVNGRLHLLGEVPRDYRTHYSFIYVPREQMCHSFGEHRHTRYNNLYTHMRR